MIFYISFLRAIATCLITNSHYTGIYPTDIIANGGLLGDILFFAVSGYCLFNVKTGFIKWYSKRIWRIYLPVIMITLIYMLLGFYTMEENNAFWWLIYPTYYHFIASIVVLYIPYYFICKIPKFRNNIPIVMAAVFLFSMIWYIAFYDRSYYHIDVVREPFVRLLFMESMLLGAYFKQNDMKFRNNGKKSLLWAVLSVALFVLYFASKLIFQRVKTISDLQIINQLIIFALLYSVMRLFSLIDCRLEKFPGFVKKTIQFLANITLEIYLVQYVIIDLLRDKLFFPINWILLTASIIVAAYLLHILCKQIFKLIDLAINRIKKIHS